MLLASSASRNNVSVFKRAGDGLNDGLRATARSHLPFHSPDRLQGHARGSRETRPVQSSEFARRGPAHFSSRPSSSRTGATHWSSASRYRLHKDVTRRCGARGRPSRLSRSLLRGRDPNAPRARDQRLSPRQARRARGAPGRPIPEIRDVNLFLIPDPASLYRSGRTSKRDHSDRHQESKNPGSCRGSSRG